MDEEAALKAEIAKLTGAISSHRHTAASSSSGPAYGYAPYRGRGRGRGATSYPYSDRGASRGRGRGRGAPLPARNRTLILNDPAASKATAAATMAMASTPGDGTDSASKPASSLSNDSAMQSADSTNNDGGAAPSAAAASSDGWIKRKTTHNMSLVSSSTFQKTEPARLAAIAATQTAKAEARAKAKQEAEQRKSAKWHASSAAAAKKGRGKAGDASVRRGDNMGEVVIDGVVFEFDPSGTKLVKKAVQPPSDASADAGAGSSTSDAAPSSAAASTATPLRTSINGQAYVRTKRGNLVSAELVAKKRAQKEQQAKLRRLAAMGKQIGELQGARYAGRKKDKRGNMTLDNTKPKGLCAFFNKTGQCKRGLSCPFIHDVNKISLCPRALRPNGCQLPAGTCPLSHNPTPERVPHCVHYLRTGRCRNGDDCVYTHSDRLADGLDTPVCDDFSRLGWCERGKECTQRHTWECPEFAADGKCERKGCRLLHVIRARADGGGPSSRPAAAADGDAQEPEGMQDGDLFMRDDAAADGEDDAEDEDGERDRAVGKRKRPLLEGQGSGVDDDHDDIEGASLSADEGVSFLSGGPSKRKRRGKAFSGQKDFISFADEDEDGGEASEDEEEDEGDAGSAPGGDDEEEEDDHASVESEDAEVSDSELDRSSGEDDEEEGEDEGDDDDDDADDADATSDHGPEPTPDAKVQYRGRADADEDDDGNDDDDDQLVESFL
ncbi:uncharacterized protein PFL1_05401 [Pseudozyma flocculosa PF-1]|uniref:C3H1-type domain-containing protein n=2 Tax=Pseudozyma flocculosa TaxID=84751 RepID=A0A5C3FA56_9BASI|nr:uncharacterized protein PFL1_05401 [Pseudozyma flocculosa PF-1]EPQ27120.1 hypothetical protein PFL1_05401 [Pseudozyma flocculosa PF-1]SPO41312.1 uncharacterized protein PSFLO_06794 [Pseudozyma flocculosa]